MVSFLPTHSLPPIFRSSQETIEPLPLLSTGGLPKLNSTTLRFYTMSFGYGDEPDPDAVMGGKHICRVGC
jgi:hypothetical protein